MADALLKDRMFQRIMRGLIDTGRAPHYAELARALGLGVEEGRLLLYDPVPMPPRPAASAMDEAMSSSGFASQISCCVSGS